MANCVFGGCQSSVSMAIQEPGFVLLLDVLEKPWNLILDFKGT